MATTPGPRYGEKTPEHAVRGAIPGLMYGVLMSGIWAGILLMVSPLLFR